MKCQFEAKAITIFHYNKHKQDKLVKARSKFNPKRQQKPCVEIDLVSNWLSRRHQFNKPVIDNVRKPEDIIDFKWVSFNTYLRKKALFLILSTCSRRF